MICEKNTGKKIRKFRLASNKTQPEFARELSLATGERIDVKTLCRMESYGKRNACHPLAPSTAVLQYIHPEFSCDKFSNEKPDRERNEHNVSREDELYSEREIKASQLNTSVVVSEKDLSHPRGDMKRQYYIRNRVCEVDQLDGVVAIKIDPNSRSQIPQRLNTDQLSVSQEELEVFEKAGWIFSSSEESSDFQRGSSVMKDQTPSGRVFRRDDGSIMIGTKVLTVKLKEGLSSETVQRKLADENLSIKRHLKFAPNLFEVIVSAEVDPINEANKLRDDEDFIYAEPVMIEHISQRYVPQDPEYNRQWQWSNDGCNGASAHADVGAEIAWNHSRGQNVRVAVIDFGIDVNHQDLNPGISPQSGYFRDDGEFVLGLNGYPSDDHGTFCAGIAGARANNGFGGCGIAFESELLLIACMDDLTGTQNIIARAIAYAANPSTEIDGMESPAGADVISCSLGPQRKRFTMQSVLEDAIKDAATKGRGGKGTSIFWAVNNFNVDFSDTSNPSNKLVCIDEVCCDPNVMAVGRSNSSDFADAAYGSKLDFIAPGVDVYSTLPNNQYGVDSGTSYATPCVAGIAALLLSIEPNLTKTDIRTILRETCDQVGGVKYDENGHNPYYGFGRINATRAINQILPVPRNTNLGILSVCYASVFTICLALFA
jgi:subtilisin family serine protease/transcriptional regulator with XRE-family HTH domain